jgi:hypothetical protein
VAFVCWVIQHRPNTRLDKGAWGWPFGRVDLRESEIVAYSPIFFGLFQLHIPYQQIVRAAVKPVKPYPSGSGGKVRLQRTASQGGDVTIGTVNDNYLKIVDRLREEGVHVTNG